jgi:hypothetical protein
VPRESEHPEGSVFRDTLAYYTLDISGPWSPANALQAGSIQHVADLPGSTRFGDRTGRVWAPRPIPFAPVGVIGVAQNRLYFSPADSFTIDVLDPDGTHHATWRIPGQFEEVTAADIQESLDAQLATPARDERNQPLASDPLSGFYRRLYDAMPFPERKAAVARILIDDLGNVWIEHYREFNTRQRPSLWSVVDPTGRLLTQIETPSNVRLTQVTAAELIGIRLNENDVESVVVYELAKRSK